MHRLWPFVCVCVAATASVWPELARGNEQAEAAMPCPARAHRAGNATIAWHFGPIDDRVALDQWCRAVGPPLVVATPAESGGTVAPPLEELVVLTWNTHLAEGELTVLIDRLRAGHLTDGKPVRHFVLFLQELYRRGDDVPPFAPDTRSAYAILPRNPRAPDARDYSRDLGLALMYVPSMRNGAGLLEDRGNAIISTERLLNTFALELPFERQRRVAVGAAINVLTPRGLSRLNLLNAHLEPLSSPSSLWVFRNPRRRQVAAILDLLRSSRFEKDGRSVGTVLGGDFNTIQGGADEEAYAQASAWSQGLVGEDRRNTHRMGRIDYLFFRLRPGWTARTARVDEKFGSDHHPVLGRFASSAPTP